MELGDSRARQLYSFPTGELGATLRPNRSADSSIYRNLANYPTVFKDKSGGLFRKSWGF